MRDFIKPTIVVSKCLGFEHCRYNGEIIAAPLVQKMVPHADFVVVCPEVESGLSVPREFLRLVAVDGEPRLLQPQTGHDHTAQMRSFAASFLDGLVDVDGFILKNRSPSCGLNDVKMYASTKKGAAATKGQGMFGGAVMERFPNLAVEDEGRLNNFRIREHFLTRIYALATFRAVKASGVMSALVQFQAENKLLLMAYHQTEMRAMGRVVANPDKRPFEQVIAEYESHLYTALTRPPRCTSHINVLMHALGYFSDGLSGQEKAFFLDTLQKYRDGLVPVSTNRGLIQSWIARFGQEYLAQQTYFEPYPEALLELTDSGKQMACLA
ncbi:MAG: YbgA family protein [Anaerolineae bacterium]|jgi:uncharacterized protein YbgA (DUF1722 family)/uncharacterized protein YbbK (DUF523 family)